MKRAEELSKQKPKKKPAPKKTAPPKQKPAEKIKNKAQKALEEIDDEDELLDYLQKQEYGTHCIQAFVNLTISTDPNVRF